MQGSSLLQITPLNKQKQQDFAKPNDDKHRDVKHRTDCMDGFLFGSMKSATYRMLNLIK